MSYSIIALFPDKHPKLVTTRNNTLAARSICHELNGINHAGDFERAFFRFIEQGKPFCNRCAKQNWNIQKGCLAPMQISSDGEWTCELGLAGQALGVTL